MAFPYQFEFYFDEDVVTVHPLIKVRIAFDTAPYVDTPTWTDVSADVQEIHIRRGRPHEMDRVEASVCTLILENSSGDYFPDNTGGSYTPNVRTLKKVNIQMSADGGVTYFDRFTGYVESWSPNWRAEAGKGPYMTVRCSDFLKPMARFLITGGGYSAEKGGARFTNILDDFPFPAADRTLDTGQETMQATGGMTNVNALEHGQKLQQSELALFYIGANGNAVFEDRSHRTNSPHDVSQAIFGDDTGEDKYRGVEFDMNEELLWNDVRFTRTGGSEQTQVDAASKTKYGQRMLERSGLLNNSDVAVSVLCDYMIARYSEVDKSRVRTLTLRPARDPSNLYFRVLNLDISSRITVRLNEAAIDGDFFIEGIKEDWTKQNGLVTIWQLSEATQLLFEPSVRTQTMSPDGTGDEQNINGASAGGDHWQFVVDGGTGTYVVNTDNPDTFDRDLYNVGAADYPSGTIQKIKVVGHFLADPEAKTVEGAVKLALKTGSTVGESGETVVSIFSYEIVEFEWTVSPDTSVAFTWAEVAALQVGPSIKKAAPFGGSDTWTRCKFIEVTVFYTPQW